MEVASSLTDAAHTGGGLLDLSWRVHVDLAAHRWVLQVDLARRHTLAMSSQATRHWIGEENISIHQ